MNMDAMYNSRNRKIWKSLVEAQWRAEEGCGRCVGPGHRAGGHHLGK